MKYYIGQIHEENGDFEYDTSFIFKLDNDNITPEEYLDTIAKNWYGESEEGEEPVLMDNEDGTYSHPDGIEVYPGKYQEITEETFNSIIKQSLK